MAKKVVKTFTVDEEVYNWFVEKLKEANVGVSVSSILDGYLKFLYQGLKEVMRYIEKKKVNLPLSYVVYKYIEDQAFFFQYDWEAIEKKGMSKSIEKDIEINIGSFIKDLEEEFQEAYRGRWKQGKLKTQISKLDREDD